MKYLFLWFFFTVLSLCQTSASQTVQTIFLVRHAEPSTAAPDGTLSPAGEKRAGCLAKMLKDSGIKQIYVTDAKITQLTVEPLASALKLKPIVIAAKDPNTLIRNLAYSGVHGNILAVADSTTLPFVLARLKAGTVPEIAASEFDRMFVVTVTEGTAAPVATLRYCDCGAAAPAATPGSSTKPVPKKPPAKKP